MHKTIPPAASPRHRIFAWAAVLALLFCTSLVFAQIEYAPAIESYGGYPSKEAYCAALPTDLYRAIPPFSYRSSGYYAGLCCMDATDPYDKVWSCAQQYNVYPRAVPVAQYSCPAGYARNAQKPVTDPEACYQVLPDPAPAANPDRNASGPDRENSAAAHNPSPLSPQNQVAPLPGSGHSDTGSEGSGSVGCDGQAGDPLNTANGSKYLAVTDYAGAAYSPLRFIRYYDSQMPQGGSLGRHWRHFYERSVQRVSATAVKLRRPDGKAFPFALVEGVWMADAAVNFRLRSIDAGWQVITPADEVETYSAEGRLQTIVARGGMAQTLTYDSDGRLSRVTDSLGRSLALAYDAQGRLSTVTDSAGGMYAYRYDSQDNLESREDPDHRLLSYRYQHPAFPHALTAVIDGRGRQIDTTFYDAKGRANSNHQGSGTGRLTLSYGDDGTATDIVDAYNTSHSFSYQLIQGVMKTTGLARRCPGCGLSARTMQRDANGNVTAVTDYNGVLTTYSYDLARNLETSRSEAAGSSVARTITTEWHATWNVPVRITEPGRTTALSYDDDGNVTQLQVTDTNTGEVRTWTYRYQAYGLLAAATLPDGRSVSYAYDAQGNLLLARSGGGQETRYSDYDGNGKVGSITYANGRHLAFTYDSRGRLLTQSETVAVDDSNADLGWLQKLLDWLRSLLSGGNPEALSDTGLAVTRYSYDAAGLLQHITLPDGQSVEYGYDDAQQLIAIRDAAGNSVQILRDPQGQPQQVLVSDASGSLVRRLQQDYDALGRLARLNGNNGQALTNSYDEEGYLLAQTNALGEGRRQERDALYRTRVTEDALGARSQIDFNPLDQVIAVSDARGNTTRFSPNAFGEITEESSPDRGRLTRGLPAGRMTQSTDARSITQRYEYDSDGRLVRQTSPQGITTWGYDEGEFGKSFLTRFQDDSGSTRYTRNSQGRVTRKISTITNGATLRVQYGYTLGGQLKALSTPGGHRLQYRYTPQGLPTALSVDGQVLLTNIRFGADGISGWTWGSGQPREETRDLDGRLTQLVSGNALNRSYGYDSADRLVQLSDTAAGVNDRYGYDAAGRLILQTGNAATGIVNYQYDLLGNRLSKDSLKSGKREYTRYDYDPANNRLLSETTGANTTAYRYLPSGQLSSAGAIAYDYNDAGRLTDVRGIHPLRQRYNALGQRVRKAGDSILLFAYDEAGHLLGEYLPGGIPLREYVWLGDRLVGLLSAQHPGVLLQVHTDHLGTPRAVSNGTTVLWRWEGEAFGNSLPNEQVAGVLRKLTMPLRFPGQYYDSETNLNYNYFRDYSSSAGRYVENDPIGLRGGLNVYAMS